MHISKSTLECHISLIITAWTIRIKVMCHTSVIWSLIPDAMAFNVGILKAVVGFNRIDSETAFELHRSRIPINNVNTVLVLKKHLGLEELSSKYGPRDFDVKLYHIAPKSGGKSDNP